MHGLYLLWWVQEKGIPAPTVAGVLAAGDLALLVVEIPTGWFADRFGHRASLITGSLVQTLGILVCWLGDGVPELVIASILVALGDGFRSGADQALLYRTCRALACEEMFQGLEARAHAAQQVALVGLVLAAGLLVELVGFGAGWAAEVAMCLTGLAMASAMFEPAGHVSSSSDVSPRGTGVFSLRMVLVILPGALLGAATGAGSFLAQTTGESQPGPVTLLVAAITLAEASGAAVAVRAPATGVRAQLTLLLAGALLSGVALVVPVTFLPVVLALSFLMGTAGPLRAATIQRLASDGVRARAASLASATWRVRSSHCPSPASPDDANAVCTSTHPAYS